MRRCENCQHGIDTVDGGGQPYVICTLIPPTSAVVDEAVEIEPGKTVTKLVIKWVRPPMTPIAFCGQHRMSWWKLLTGGKGT